MKPASGSGGASGAASDAGMMSDDAGPKHVVPPTPDKPEPCSVSGCPPDLMCEASGVCVTPPPECVADKDCAADQHCGLTGECLGKGECRVRDDCASAETCAGKTMCMVGSDCGQTQLTIEPIPPNLLVLLDISLSMNDGLDGCSGLILPCDPSKMFVATQVMAQMTTSYRDTIYWGLAEFPEGDCGAPTSAIAPGPGNADMVSSKIMSTTPTGFTPLNASVKYVQDSTLLKDATRGNYLLLLTDGSETCNVDSKGNPDMANQATIQRITDMAAIGTKTFVVGFGGGVDTKVLNDFANAGGVPSTTGSNAYYQADSATELESALGAILKRVIGCDFALNAPPDDPSKVWAFLDDVMVERDTDDGWKLDTATNTVTFMGASCAMLQAGTVTDIDIVTGCPEPVLD